MSQETAEIYAEAMRHLALKARGVVRDLDPKSEMKYMRIRAKRHEVLVAFGEKYTIDLPLLWCNLLSSRGHCFVNRGHVKILQHWFSVSS